ncbi:hypothetical protein C823_004790 [Eubacterium plexicaudatum ASF492]|nr:hypothetical protein C823_004790 [Eubacterium plexicaudatum ASF492]
MVSIRSFVKLSGLSALLLVGVFCFAMSGEGIYLSLYKMALAFYFLAICVVLGIDISRLWFDGNRWVDLLIRVIIIVIVILFVTKKFRKSFLYNLDFLREEMDRFSVVTMLISIMAASIIIYWPNGHPLSIGNVVRLLANLIMAGIVQYTVFHLYIHLGKEHIYQEENRILAMNEQLLRFQRALADEAEERAARIRHDVRHHCLLIQDYVKKGEMDQLLYYLNQYIEDVECAGVKRICENRTIDSILSVYARQAEMNGTKVEMDVVVAEHSPVRDIDLVAILANVFENAIHGAGQSGVADAKIKMSIRQKGHKLVIQCRNTICPGQRFDGEAGIGMASIRKTAQRYDGETDFSVEDGMFVTRILLNIEY